MHTLHAATISQLCNMLENPPQNMTLSNEETFNVTLSKLAFERNELALEHFCGDFDAMKGLIERIDALLTKHCV